MTKTTSELNVLQVMFLFLSFDFVSARPGLRLVAYASESAT
jgi:hypothetical protein